MIDLLEGVRVLEVDTTPAVAALGSILADLGADVIKVEGPGGTDALRAGPGQVSPGNSPAHLRLNANKRAVVIDLDDPDGRALFWRLHATAEVVVTGALGDALDERGIGVAEQLRRRPSVVVAQLTGYGATGPYRQVRSTSQAQSSMAADWPMAAGDDGLLHLDRRPTTIIRKASDPLQAGSLWAALATAAAVDSARRTGVGAHLDVSAAEAVVAISSTSDVYTLNDARIPDKSTMAPVDSIAEECLGAKYQHYQTAEGGVVLFGSAEPWFWNNFCRAVDRPDLLVDPDGGDVVDWAPDLDLRLALQEIFLTRTAAAWTELAATHNFVCSPAPRTVLDTRQDPHIAARDLFLDGVDPHGEPFTYVGIPAVMPGQSFAVARPAPAAGEHDDEVLGPLLAAGTAPPGGTGPGC